MPNLIISDTSCLIFLTNIGELELLHRLYGQIITTSDIANEYGEKLHEWIQVAKITSFNGRLQMALVGFCGGNAD